MINPNTSNARKPRRKMNNDDISLGTVLAKLDYIGSTLTRLENKIDKQNSDIAELQVWKATANALINEHTNSIQRIFAALDRRNIEEPRTTSNKDRIIFALIAVITGIITLATGLVDKVWK